MKKQRDLFRWFIGGLTIAGVVAGVAAAATPPSVSPSPPPLAIPSAASAQAVESAAVQAPKDAPKPSGEIWACTINGVKTFSSNPCGQKSSLVTLRPINTMKPTPVIRSARANDPQRPDHTDQSSYSDQNASATGFADNSYPVDQGYQDYVYAPVFRPNHHHRSEHHRDSSEPHRPGPKPHDSAPEPQSTMPAPRKH